MKNIPFNSTILLQIYSLMYTKIYYELCLVMTKDFKEPKCLSMALGKLRYHSAMQQLKIMSFSTCWFGKIVKRKMQGPKINIFCSSLPKLIQYTLSFPITMHTPFIYTYNTYIHVQSHIYKLTIFLGEGLGVCLWKEVYVCICFGSLWTFPCVSTTFKQKS